MISLKQFTMVIKAHLDMGQVKFMETGMEIPVTLIETTDRGFNIYLSNGQMFSLKIEPHNATRTKG